MRVLGHELGALTDSARDRFRADHIGVIFQMFNLIPYLSVRENVCLPCAFSARRRNRCEQSGNQCPGSRRRAFSITSTWGIVRCWAAR